MSTLSCPHCHNVVFEDETVCPHCGAWLDGPHARGGAGGARGSNADYRPSPSADDPDATMVDQGAIGGGPRTGQATRARSSARNYSAGAAGAAPRKPIDPSKAPQRSGRPRRAADTTAQTAAIIVVALLGAMVLIFYGINRFSGGKGNPGSSGPIEDPLDGPGIVKTPTSLKYQKVVARREPGRLVLLVETPGGQLPQTECVEIRDHIAIVLNSHNTAGTLVDEFNAIDVYRAWRADGGKVSLEIRAPGKTQSYYSQDFGIAGG